ncbi:MAG: Hint domain [Verrucomicrobiota bacterium]
MKFFPVIAVLAIPLMVTTLTGCSLVGGLLNAALPFAGIKLVFACIPEGTLIDTPGTPSPIEKIEPGDLVIGYSGRPVRVLQKHSYLEDEQTIFLRIQFTDGASVDLCSRHRLAGVPANRLRAGQAIAGRTVAKIETRTGETRSFDLLTEDAGYRINGVPVNSMIEEMHAAAAGLPMQRVD